MFCFFSFFLCLIQKKEKTNTRSPEAVNSYTPEFLNIEDKKKLDIPAEVKVQVFKRDESGNVEVYKIIKNDWDLVNNLE